MSRQARKSKPSQLEKRLEGYAQAAGSLLHVVKKGGARKLVPMTTAAGAALAMAPAADATIVYSGLINEPLPVSPPISSYVSVNLDLDGAGAESDVRLQFTNIGTSMNTYANISALSVGQGIFATSGSYYNAAMLVSGAQIGPSFSAIVFGAGTDPSMPPGSQFLSLREFYGNTGFAGVQFNIGGLPHFAWLRLKVDAAGNALEVVDWAYEDTPNTAISAGAVPAPEPGSGALVGLGLLALGARGVRHRRKRLAEIDRAVEAPGSSDR